MTEMNLQIIFPAARKVLGFLIAKGLLFSPHIAPNASVKLTVDDFILTAEQVEPRVLAVLPAAIIHFPKTFLDRDNFPQKILDILEAIRADRENGPSLAHVPYEELKRWANAKLSDKRTKPLKELRIRKTYRFHPRVVASLESAASAQGRSETELIEELIFQHI